MKSTGFQFLAVALCLSLAAALAWNTLPTNAEGNSATCPLGGGACDGKSLKAAKADACCEGDPAAAAASCPMKALGAKLSEAKGGCATGACPMDAAQQAVEKKDGDKATTDSNIAKLVMSDSRFTTFALAVKAAGLAGEFECPKAKTVFAPTNEAFQKLPADQWVAILQDDAKLKALVSNHIVTDNALQSCAMKETKSAKASGGAELAISACPITGQLSVNAAKVVGEDLVASNGVVHAVDAVLLPAGMELAKSEAVATPAAIVAKN